MARNCQPFPFLASSAPFENVALNVVRGECAGTCQREELIVAENSEGIQKCKGNCNLAQKYLLCTHT